MSVFTSVANIMFDGKSSCLMLKPLMTLQQQIDGTFKGISCYVAFAAFFITLSRHNKFQTESQSNHSTGSLCHVKIPVVFDFAQ